MKRYSIYTIVTGRIWMDVEADTIKQAMEKAQRNTTNEINAKILIDEIHAVAGFEIDPEAQIQRPWWCPLIKIRVYRKPPSVARMQRIYEKQNRRSKNGTQRATRKGLPHHHD